MAKQNGQNRGWHSHGRKTVETGWLCEHCGAQIWPNARGGLLGLCDLCEALQGAAFWGFLSLSENAHRLTELSCLNFGGGR